MNAKLKIAVVAVAVAGLAFASPTLAQSSSETWVTLGHNACEQHGRPIASAIISKHRSISFGDALRLLENIEASYPPGKLGAAYMAMDRLALEVAYASGSARYSTDDALLQEYMTACYSQIPTVLQRGY